MQIAAGIKDAAEHADGTGPRRHQQAVAIFELEGGQLAAARRQLQHDASARALGPQGRQQARIGALAAGRSCSLLGVAGALGRNISGQIGLEIAQGAVVVLLLRCPDAFAVEFGAEHICLVCQATGGGQSVGDRALRRQHVLPGPRHFTFHSHTFVLALHRQGAVDSAEGAQHVAALQGAVAGSGQVQLHDAHCGPIIQALDSQARAVGDGRKAPGHAQQVGHRLAGFELEDRCAIDAADQCHLGAHRPDMDHVVALQHAVSAAVAAEQEVIHVVAGDALVAAPELDVAKASCGRRATSLEQRLHDGGQAADVVAARLGHEAGHVHPLATQLAERHAQLKVAKHLRHALADRARQVGIAHPRHQHRADARDIDAAAAVDLEAQVGIDRAPQRHHDFVAGFDEVIRRYQRQSLSGFIRWHHQFGAEATNLDWHRIGAKAMGIYRRAQALHKDLELAQRGPGSPGGRLRQDSSRLGRNLKRRLKGSLLRCRGGRLAQSNRAAGGTGCRIDGGRRALRLRQSSGQTCQRDDHPGQHCITRQASGESLSATNTKVLRCTHGPGGCGMDGAFH